jgi:hypothetical protein
MADYLKTALLLEEKAAKLPLREPRSAYLLAIARAARLMGIEQLAGGSPEPQRGTLGKRAEVYAGMLANE